MLDGIHDKVRQLNDEHPAEGHADPSRSTTAPTLVGDTLGTVHHNLLFGALLVVGDRLAVPAQHPRAR